ncbi:hypothetical protein [Vibrio nomapromontoriensis]|uniref:hypothetical protein n=1 Tax=Vibrio nomapromontoriensis TaxID=2910246 RepID=UPI003D0A489F
MKIRLFSIVVVLLTGCAIHNPASKINSYQLCVALSQHEVIRNANSPLQFNMSDRQIKQELERRLIDPMGIQCGAVGEKHKHMKIMKELRLAKEYTYK